MTHGHSNFRHAFYKVLASPRCDVSVPDTHLGPFYIVVLLVTSH